MTDQDVMKALDDLEHYLAVDQSSWDPAHLEMLHDRFRAAVSGAERGPDWLAIVERAQSIHLVLQGRLASVILQRDAIRKDLEGQEVGQRALIAYKSNNG
ncbi:MAG TPA: hypothetical protein PKL14_04765 [Holophaga sp.]|jgi:hypothetical protein|nr:hypothetical protein [Holophaga sp.]